MKQVGQQGSSSFFGNPFAGKGVEFYCINCGTKHNKVSCPKCGSKMKKAGF
jgi:rubrerythrin